MSLRWRKTGELLCGAKSQPMDGDTYIDDGLHYELSVIQKMLVADRNEKENGRWYWLHINHYLLTNNTMKEFPEEKENYCPQCYFENDKVILRKDCPHNK